MKRFQNSEEKLKDVFRLRSKSSSVLEFNRTQEELVQYVSIAYKQSEDIKWMVKNLEDKKFEEPKVPTKYKNDRVRDEVFKKSIDIFIARKTSYEEAKSKLWEVIWYQCTKRLQSKLESNDEYWKMAQVNDCAGLLTLIRKLMFTDENNNYEPISVYNAKLNSLICRQGEKETVNKYYNRFKGVIEVLAYHDCSSGGDDMGLVYYEMEQAGEDIDKTTQVPGDSDYKAYKALAMERFWATILIVNADNKRFGKLKQELANAYVKGRNEYLTTVLAAYELLLKQQGMGDNGTTIATASTVSLSDNSEEEENEDSKDAETQDFLSKM